MRLYEARIQVHGNLPRPIPQYVLIAIVKVFPRIDELTSDEGMVAVPGTDFLLGVQLGEGRGIVLLRAMDLR